MRKILIVVGTRPNFIKVTQFKRAATHYPEMEVKIVHTGQHYDHRMSNVFFQQFGLEPDYFLEIPSASPNTQMAEIMIRLEKVIKEDFHPDLLVVVGDVNSTAAAAMTGNKMGIPLAHLESGLRSNDRTMPEEINRLIADELSDFYFVTEPSGLKNLEAEQRSGRTFFVGNTMIDTMVAFEEEIAASNILTKLDIGEQPFILMTIHRPATVDQQGELEKLMQLLQVLGEKYRLVFPIHPRTVNNLKKFEMYESFAALPGLILTEPMDYFAFQKLIKHCSLILTDSGGIQEESTFRQVPCLTLRPNTERPVTVTIGTNELITFDVERILQKIAQIEEGTYKSGQIPEHWDGKATERILELIQNF